MNRYQLLTVFYLIALLSFTAEPRESDTYYINGLKQSKYFLINGQVHQAQLTLDRLQLYKSKMAPIHKRYFAISHFLQSDFEKSLNLIHKVYKAENGNRLIWRARLCELEIINMFILDKSPAQIDSAWKQCREITVNIGLEPSLWIQSFLDVRNSQSISVFNNPLETLKDDELKAVLKLSLYLDSSHRFVEQLKKLNYKDFNDVILRETTAEIYYRNHKLVEALEVLRGLETLTSLVIKSDIASLQGKFELAYANLKKAYQVKDYSPAILDRIIPLAIILDQTNELETYLDQLSKQEGLTIPIQSLGSYSYYIQDKAKTAARFLEKVELQRNLSFEEVALTAFSLYRSNAKKSYEAGYNLCQQETSFCWLPVLDAYQLKRKKGRTVLNKNPLDGFNNLAEEGFLSEQEEIFVDTELLDQKQQYSEYLINRSNQ